MLVHFTKELLGFPQREKHKQNTTATRRKMLKSLESETETKAETNKTEKKIQNKKLKALHLQVLGMEISISMLILHPISICGFAEGGWGRFN